MSNTATVITDHTITTTSMTDCLLDAMLAAQSALGQITWEDITDAAARGTYRDTAGHPRPVAVIDTHATAQLHSAITEWMAR